MNTLFAVVAIFGCCTTDYTADLTAKFVIFAEPVPAHANRQYPTQYRLLPSGDGSVGFIQLYRSRDDGLGIAENGKLEVVSYPKLEVREGAYGRTIGSWPCLGDGIVESAESDSWIEDRRDDNGILKPKPFHSVKIVLSSMVAGIHNDVAIFATDYDKPEKLIKGRWIILDLDNALKLVDYIDAGDTVIIAVESPDSS